ncbi:hypothetical protein [Sphingomonas sp. Leaf10]|uniref:hypothetical protein n=1 Tax=Sphingomonas sp. Leaf10 TaxID=1735676 RepID=UPI0006F59D4C|nr:hypothetical protein [Sphingomonas sp. Leaf10]KQM37934.1 hypothetical protein ASE59_11580 [Sphingomonas sp. Leaf10]
MSYPTEIDAVIVKLGNGASPEVFANICGVENATINETVQSSDRFRRDCAKPGMIPRRAVRVTGQQWDVTGSGVTNVDQIAALKAVLGIRRNYELVAIKYDGTDEGDVLGTFKGAGVMTARNMSLSPNEATMEVTIAGEDELVWTPVA